MNELKSAAILQARVYDFLGQQDESTLQAIVSGALRLAVVHADDAQPLGTVPNTMEPSTDPTQVARDVSRLTSERERRIYLNATGLSVDRLRRTAKLLGLTHYSALRKPELVDLLAGYGTDRPEAPTGESETPASSSSQPMNRDSETEQRTTVEDARPLAVAPSTETARPDVDVAAIATRLRETETEEDGATYLHAQRLDHESLLAVAAELQLTRVNRLSQVDLEKRVLKQAIGARRKFAGLRRW